jgi:hypothetical protein
MTASPNSPRSGETVSDASFSEREYLLEHVDGEIAGIIDALRMDTVVAKGNTLEDRHRAVQRARFQLELLEGLLDDQLGDDGLDVRLVEDVEEMRQ